MRISNDNQSLKFTNDDDDDDDERYELCTEQMMDGCGWFGLGLKTCDLFVLQFVLVVFFFLQLIQTQTQSKQTITFLIQF